MNISWSCPQCGMKNGCAHLPAVSGGGMNNADRSTLLDTLQAAVREAEERDLEARQLLREAWDAGISDSEIGRAIGWSAARVRMRHRRQDSLA